MVKLFQDKMAGGKLVAYFIFHTNTNSNTNTYTKLFQDKMAGGRFDIQNTNQLSVKYFST